MPSTHAQLTLDELTTSAEAIRILGLRCLASLRTNRSRALSSCDTEYVHQLRVALRRLRSTFTAFGELLPREQIEQRIADIRWLSGELGPVRDWDVFMTRCLHPLLQQAPGHRGLLEVARSGQRRRRALQARARRALSSRRYARFVQSLGAWLADGSWHALAGAEQLRVLREPAICYAPTALGRCYARVVRRARGVMHLGPAELHRLRIATKKLRYMAEFFAPLYPDARPRQMVAALEQMQDTLGGMNDAARAGAFIRHVQAGEEGGLVADAVVLLSSWNRAAIARHRRRLKGAGRAFRAAPCFWTDDPVAPARPALAPLPVRRTRRGRMVAAR